MKGMIKQGTRRIEKIAKSVLPSSILVPLKRYRHRKDVASFKPYVLNKKIGDISFDFYVGDTTGKKWYDSAGTSESREMASLRELLVKPGDVVLECGSHHGYTTMLLSHWVGDKGKVYAFEPSETSFGILQKNIEINRRSNIQPRMAAVGETKGTIKISDSSCASVSTDNVGYPVDVVTLDEFADLKPDLVKIDVEGFEAAVLKGGAALLKSKPKLAIELHTELLADYHTSVEEILSLFNANQYDVWIQWSTDEKPVRYRGEKIQKRVHLFCIPTAS